MSYVFNPFTGSLDFDSDTDTSVELYTERASQNLTAASNTISVTDGSPVSPITSNGNYTVSSAPTIANGRDGQIAILINTGSNTITLQDMGTLGGSNLRLGATTRALSPLRGTIELVYDTTMSGWVERSFNNVLTFTPSVSGLTIDGSSAITNREVASAASADATPSFVATYVGVPSTASIDIDAGGGEISGSDYPITLPSPYTSLNSGTTPPSKAFYKGTSVAQVRTFTITATVSGTAGLTRNCTVTYYNSRYAGANTQSTQLSTAQVLALAFSEVSSSNPPTGTFAITTTAGQYMWYAHRSAYTTITQFGITTTASGGYGGGVERIGFSDLSTMSHTNASGFAETFRQYRSTNTNFGASKTFTPSTSTVNRRIYMGPDTNGTDTITTGQILTLAPSGTSTGTSRVASTVPATYTVTIASGEYLWFCHPSAISDLATIKDNSTGFGVAGSYRNNISHTNDFGHTETYRCWRSDNSNIFPSGGTIVVT
jgi:hypothetical protein